MNNSPARRAFLTAIVLVLVAVPAAYGQRALSVDAVVGFGGIFRAGSWTPVHVTAQNLGQDVQGELELAITRGNRLGDDQYEVRIIRDLELVSGASKSFSFVLPLDTTVYPITIRIRDGQELAHEEQYDLLGKSVPGRLIVVLSRRPNLDFLLPLYNTQEERNLDIVYPLPDYLPASWQGYEGVDVVVIHDARLQDMDSEQLVALRDWAATGGRIVVSGGAHFGPADAQSLEPLVDLTAGAVTTARVEDAGILQAGLPVDPNERASVVVMTPFGSSAPTIERREIGAGDVILLPMDYANLAAVAPLTSVGLWNTLLSPQPSSTPIATELRRRVFETDILANQLSLPVYDFPSRLLVLGLVASYVIGLAALLVWLKRGTSRTRTILGLPLIAGLALLVAVVGHVSLTVQLQPEEALELTIEQADVTGAGGYAVVMRDTALFSLQESTYSVRYRDTPVLVPLDDGDHTVRLEPGYSAQNHQIERWGYDNGLAVQVVPFDVRGRVIAGADFVELEVQNRSERTVRDLVVLWNGFPTSLGNTGPGSVVETVLRGASGGDFQSIDWSQYVAADDLLENRERLLGDLARQQRFENRINELLVVGWTDTPLLPVVVEPSFDRTIDLHIVTMRLPVERPTGLEAE